MAKKIVDSPNAGPKAGAKTGPKTASYPQVPPKEVPPSPAGGTASAAPAAVGQGKAPPLTAPEARPSTSAPARAEAPATPRPRAAAAPATPAPTPVALDMSELVKTAPESLLTPTPEVETSTPPPVPAPVPSTLPEPPPAPVPEPVLAVALTSIPASVPEAAPSPAQAPSPAPVSAPVPSPVPPPLPSEPQGPQLVEEPESVHILEPFPEQPEPPPNPEPSPHLYHGPSLYIAQISPEMAPVAKVGGLGDVVFGLARELAIRGNHVEIILPKYDTLRYDHIYELHVTYQDLWVPWYEGAIHCTVYFGFVHDRKCFFIEPHSPDNFFNRGSIYGFNDDLLRYAFFSRAAMEFLFKAGKHPDIIHCHDWQTALVPVFLYEIYQHLGMTHSRVCLTIHNFKHQGVCGQELLRATGLGRPEHFSDYSRLRDNHNPHALNLLKGGIVYANFTTTVSPRYAFETRDGGQGFGLEPTLHTHHLKYGGVVNGIDYDVWNPEVDHYLPTRYGLDTIDGKYANKRELRHRFLLADNEKPIIAFIGRLDPQKGLELVRHAIFYCLEHGAQFVLLGSSPDPHINADFWGLKRMLNDSPDCHLEIGYDEELSHLIYSGADMILVPSQFEPCGLTQLIALRYGTIPIVRAVGGLADTVFDKDYSHRPLHERNGYVFENYDHPGLESALGRAIACYYDHPDHFRELMKNAMRSDYSWNIPGMDYLNIYNYIRDK